MGDKGACVMKRRLVVGMLTAVLTLALCGCSGSVGDKQAKQKIDAAIDKLDGIKSVENTISSNMDVELLGEKIDVYKRQMRKLGAAPASTQCA